MHARRGAWWGTFAWDVCTTRQVTITDVRVAHEGQLLAWRPYLYATPEARHATPKRPPWGASPGRPPRFGPYRLGPWVRRARGARVSPFPCDGRGPQGPFAQLMLAFETGNEGAKVTTVTLDYSDGQETYTTSTSAFTAVLCGREITDNCG